MQVDAFGSYRVELFDTTNKEVLLTALVADIDNHASPTQKMLQLHFIDRDGHASDTVMTKQELLFFLSKLTMVVKKL